MLDEIDGKTLNEWERWADEQFGKWPRKISRARFLAFCSAIDGRDNQIKQLKDKLRPPITIFTGEPRS